jgi:AcrR family transcriptional regulator
VHPPTAFPVRATTAVPPGRRSEAAARREAPAGRSEAAARRQAVAGPGEAADRRTAVRQRAAAPARRRDGPRARAALLDAAAAVFAERGFADASVDDIAARAGYSKGALYWHFESKDELFLALVEDRLERPTREMIELLETAPPERDMAPEGSRRLADVLSGERDLLLLEREYALQAARDRQLRERYARHRAELRKALGQALDVRVRHLGAPPLGDRAEDMARIVLGVAAGLAEQDLIEPGAVARDLFGEAIVLVFRGWNAGSR